MITSTTSIATTITSLLQPSIQSWDFFKMFQVVEMIFYKWISGNGCLLSWKSAARWVLCICRCFFISSSTYFVHESSTMAVVPQYCIIRNMSHQGVRQTVVIFRFLSIRVHRQNMTFYICHFQSLTTFKATHGIDIWKVKDYNFARQSLSFFNGTYNIDQRPLKSKWSMVPLLDPFLSCQSRAILPKTIQTWKTFVAIFWFDFFSLWLLISCNYTVTRHFLLLTSTFFFCRYTLSQTFYHATYPFTEPCSYTFETMISCYFCPSIFESLSPPRPAHLLSSKP